MACVFMINRWGAHRNCGVSANMLTAWPCVVKWDVYVLLEKVGHCHHRWRGWLCETMSYIPYDSSFSMSPDQRKTQHTLVFRVNVEMNLNRLNGEDGVPGDGRLGCVLAWDHPKRWSPSPWFSIIGFYWESFVTGAGDKWSTQVAVSQFPAIELVFQVCLTWNVSACSRRKYHNSSNY